MRIVLILAALPLLSGCLFDNPYGGPNRLWVLERLDGAPFAAHATLQFPARGRIGGEAPCNAWGGDMTTSYPLFDAERVIATRRACPKLTEETRFFAALDAVRQARVEGGTLTLTGDNGHEMVFTATE